MHVLKVKIILDKELLQHFPVTQLYRIAGWIEVINKYYSDVRVQGKVPSVVIRNDKAIMQFYCGEEAYRVIIDYIKKECICFKEFNISYTKKEES